MSRRAPGCGRGPDRPARTWAGVAAAILLGTLSAVGPRPATAQDGGERLAAAREAFLGGRYEEALASYEDLTTPEEPRPEAWRGRVRVLARLGRYSEAEETARRGARATAGPELWTPLGQALRSRGRLDEAEDAFRRALNEGAADSLQARLELALLRFERGRREEALRTFDGFVDVYNRNRGLSGEALTAVGTAVRHLGRGDPDLFRDALRAYDEAVAADSALLEPRLLLGDLFLSKYNSADARATYREALARDPRHPDALLGLARALDFDHEPEAAETARRALETNPDHVGVRAFLARLHLELERYDEAAREARRALEVNPASSEALSVLAALHWLTDDTASYAGVRERFLSHYPGSPVLALTTAELSATHRRYDEAVVLAAEAVEQDPGSWEAVGLLGLNQLRTGAMEEGRANLERAFEGDPYNVWFKNTLDLLDTLSEYETLTTEHFEIVLHRNEAPVLGPYVERVAEDAFDALTERYGVTPPTPIRVEVFPRHADFSVRTVGLTGMGALGVSFGKVIALDSPSARDPASFNWASALWHEVAHSVHLALSRHRVPRWFSEGLAVEDQRRGRAGWGHGPTPAFLRAYAAGRLPSATRLNDGFMRPEFPGQVVLSYFQASQVFRFVEEGWGPGTARSLLEGYGDGRATDELLGSVLDVSPRAFDRRFDRWLRERFEGPLSAVEGGGGEAVAHDGDRAALEAAVEDDPGDFQARLGLGALLREAGELEAAAPHLEVALRLFPGYAGHDGPHWHLARIRREQGRAEEALRHLASLRSVNESHLPGALLEARVREERVDYAGAAAALERALEIAPLEVEVHERLAGVYGRLGRRDDAVREREAVVALEPVDMAEAYYRLARARLEAGDRTGARDALLRALERAPRHQEALDLLLELRSGLPGPPSPEATDGVGSER
ncbi:MAG: tetratricopeptide repeat protein [Gemmatimonadetes bacterium]|nr:tetratricopeptide repeat protein [Gemmatimonadota bacterium]NIR79527.1 tetratricopeptide repeat protein [Gemmatimonadota bacterium]NIT88203.1 tetratricopeptide repeat protein [Gemmatimonadota bacterium]NIU32011.1 tetratricopeptide repeat protein [Gemmatimonadota bacterium]NIU36620.1 tetratricopeptide repeat protein [Gemmatimonadota bacterium]